MKELGDIPVIATVATEGKGINRLLNNVLRYLCVMCMCMYVCMYVYVFVYDCTFMYAYKYIPVIATVATEGKD
jgi:uncharacterized membrane protein YesL